MEEELWYPRFTYDGHSKSYYDELVSKAEQFSRLGKHTEALKNHLEALAGYRNLLSPTHDLIISSVYKVAQLHMQLHDSKAADRVLESATEAHVLEHGFWGERTVQHISQLIKMLQGWARQNEALPLVLHMLQGQEHGSYSNLSSSTISINFDATGIQRHLAMADMLAPVMNETTKAELVAIAQCCEAQPLDFPQQTLDVWLALIRTYKDAEEDGNVQDALDRAASSVRTLSGLEDPA